MGDEEVKARAGALSNPNGTEAEDKSNREDNRIDMYHGEKCGSDECD
jgi:hypothetical protein